MCRGGVEKLDIQVMAPYVATNEQFNEAGAAAMLAKNDTAGQGQWFFNFVFFAQNQYFNFNFIKSKLKESLFLRMNIWNSSNNRKSLFSDKKKLTNFHCKIIFKND